MAGPDGPRVQLLMLKPAKDAPQGLAPSCKGMKIRRIDVFQLEVPYPGGIYYLSGGREYPSFDGTFACILHNHRVRS